MIILVFNCHLDRANFVNACKFNLDFKVDTSDVLQECQIYNNQWITTVIEDITKEKVSKLNKRYPYDILLVNPKKTIKLNHNWYHCKSADEIEAFMGLPLGKHAKNRITFLIYKQTIGWDDVVESFLDRLPKPNIVVMEEEEEAEEPIREIKRIKAVHCLSCFDEDKSMVMFDCGHEPFCIDCSKVWKLSCPVCREKPKTIFLNYEEKK